jgi:hypothetical protein
LAILGRNHEPFFICCCASCTLLLLPKPRPATRLELAAALPLSGVQSASGHAFAFIWLISRDVNWPCIWQTIATLKAVGPLTEFVTDLSNSALRFFRVIALARPVVVEAYPGTGWKEIVAHTGFLTRVLSRVKTHEDAQQWIG